MATYEEALVWLRKYAEMQKACGYPASLQDLREYRDWKNMPHDPEYDERLLRDVNDNDYRAINFT